MSDLYPTKTRLALLQSVDAGDVWHDQFFPYEDYLIEPGRPDRKVTSRCLELERAGWIEVTKGEARKRRGTAFVLTADGRAVLDAGRLWAMHVTGPDDIVAMPDKAAAQAAADQVNAIAAQLKARPDASELDPEISAAVIEWTGTAAEHAEELAEHGGEYAP